jgi:hypothetical protein
MKDRGLKTRTPFSSTLETRLYEELKLYSQDTGIPVSKILDKAVKKYLESVSK